uniref:[histone H3]-lysine(4) N-trimethyltransferase n=1 Tax=Parastrongyloides trichosuri TaxID=131310 RepID=A0A0N4ZUH1_PARTI
MEFSIDLKNSIEEVYEHNGQSKHKTKDNWIIIKSNKKFIYEKDEKIPKQYKRKNGICIDEPELNKEQVKDPRKLSNYPQRNLDQNGLWPLTFEKIDKEHVGLPPIRDVSIFNLNDNCSEEYLKEQFRDSPPMTDLKIVYHPTTKRHMKMAVASFSSHGRAKYFAQKYNNTFILGEKIKCYTDQCAFGLSEEYEKITGMSFPLLKSFEDIKNLNVIKQWKMMWDSKKEKVEKYGNEKEDYIEKESITIMSNTPSTPPLISNSRRHSSVNSPIDSCDSHKPLKRKRSSERSSRKLVDKKESNKRKSYSNSNSDSDMEYRSSKRNRISRSYSKKTRRSPSYDSDYKSRRKSSKYEKNLVDNKLHKEQPKSSSIVKRSNSNSEFVNGNAEQQEVLKNNHETALSSRLKLLFPQRFQSKESAEENIPQVKENTNDAIDVKNVECIRPKISFSLTMKNKDISQVKEEIEKNEIIKEDDKEHKHEKQKIEKLTKMIDSCVKIVPSSTKEYHSKFCEKFSEVLNAKVNKLFVNFIHELVDKDFNSLFEEHEKSSEKKDEIISNDHSNSNNAPFLAQNSKGTKKFDWSMVTKIPKIQKINKDIVKKKKDRKITPNEINEKPIIIKKESRIRSISSSSEEDVVGKPYRDIQLVAEPISSDDDDVYNKETSTCHSSEINEDSLPNNLEIDESDMVPISSDSSERSSTVVSSYVDESTIEDDNSQQIKFSEDYSATAYDDFEIDELMSNIIDTDFINVDDKRFQVLSQFNLNVDKVKIDNAPKRTEKQRLKILSRYDSGFADDEDRLFLKDVLDDEDVSDIVTVLKQSGLSTSYTPAPQSFSKPIQLTKQFRFNNQIFFYNDQSLANVVPTTGGCSKISEQRREEKKYRTLIRQTEHYRTEISKSEESASILEKNKNREEKALMRQIASETDKFDPSKTNLLKYRKKLTQFKKSHIHGYGLFALEDIHPNEMIIEYVGEKVRSTVCDVREKAYERRGMGSSYLFRVNEQCVIDATLKGGVSRFVNHCCVPNSYARIISVDKDPRIVIYSKTFIKKGDEITYDYKFPLENEKIPCLCGHPGCRKFLN